jgi:hypothetical protein
MQTLDVLNTVFNSNTGTDAEAAGAARVSQGIYSDPTTFLWKNNSGSGNFGSCSGVSFNNDCFAIDESFVPS